MSKKNTNPIRENPHPPLLSQQFKQASHKNMATSTSTTSTSEEFTFPTFTGGVDSPPLWRLSPAASPSRPASNEQRLENKIGSHNGEEDEEEDEEEKMDMLWEDFNEELVSYRRQGDKRLLDPAEMVEMGCFQALKLNKRESALFSRRPGLVEIIKVLKKLFLLHNNYSHQHHRPAR